jgi:hypothetical protein
MNKWPALPFAEWSDTCATLHMWTQVVGKIRMAKSPPVNHWWHVPLYVTSRGIGTSPIPDGARTFEIDFDLLDHRLLISTSEGERHELKLEPMSVARFYGRVMDVLHELKIEVDIRTLPSEVENPIAFEKDETHASYDSEAVSRFFQVLVQTCRVFTEFRSRFLGKVSPIHFFWGSFDLAVTRFSGRPAPAHPGAPGLPLEVTREAYSHEVSSAGFWPGNASMEAMFYSYAYPEPEGYAKAPAGPAGASYSDTMREFIYPYEAMRAASDPEAALHQFLEATYDAAADLAKWDRKALERAKEK